MKGAIYVLTTLAVFGLALWAYQENYRTQEALKQAGRLQGQIGAAQARLGVLRAEWAYLNRPDRLRELAELNFDRLGLLPFRPDQFGRVDEVAYPAIPVPEIKIETENGIDVIAIMEGQFP